MKALHVEYDVTVSRITGREWRVSIAGGRGICRWNGSGE